ncbi:DUF805 domain-containing protein [Streptomyces sp. NPDC005728]|uniref:DUF805 domain-containing protein n=1 Tax=Streptomyces sp. NPDC005728 TaxID=3157054 RepID=UPI0033C9B55A
MHWYVDALKKYAVFTGRARRTEYWTFSLVNLLIALALLVIDRPLGFDYPRSLFALAILLPSLAVSVRRLHDTGRSGWWLLIGLIPVIGPITVLVFTAIEGEPGDNTYGASPKYVPEHL